MEQVTDRVLRAKQFAIQAHGTQMYGEGLPYEYHLQKVVNTLITAGVHNKEALMAGWLHDVVEDTPVTVQDLEKQFGWEVAWIVWSVSNGPGANRAEKHSVTYPKICACPLAVVVKLADRVANMRASLGAAKKLDNLKPLKMYLKEAESFKQGVRVPYARDHMTWALILRETLEGLEQEGREFLRIPQL